MGTSCIALAQNMSFPVKNAEFFSRIPGEIGRFPGDQTRVLMDHNATRDNIDLAITEWLVDNVTSGDLVVVYFSGHGAHIQDYDGDEEDGLDEFIVPFDAVMQSNSNIIIDDVFAN